MKQLNNHQIALLRVLVDRKMDSLETAITNNNSSPFTEIALKEYNEIDAILKDMKEKTN
jgi:hypothetical protein